MKNHANGIWLILRAIHAKHIEKKWLLSTLHCLPFASKTSHIYNHSLYAI